MDTAQDRNLKVSLEWSPVYEFALSLYVYTNKKNRKTFELGQDWYKQVSKQLSVPFKEKLEQNQFVLELGIDLLIVHRAPEKERILDFLNWLKHIDDESFESLVHSVVIDQDALTEMLKTLKNHHQLNTVGSLLPFIREHLFELWQGWYEDYFSSIDQDILRQLYLNVEQKKEWLQMMNPFEIIEKATHGLFIEDIGTDHIILIPQYHSSPFNIFTRVNTKEEQTQIFFYPIDLDFSDAHAEDPPAKVMRVVRCLSDQNRLKILRFLYQERKSFTDIVRHIGLAKSTVHHHMVMLRAAGLVRLYVSEKHGNRYSLRESEVEEIPGHILGFITGASHI